MRNDRPAHALYRRCAAPYRGHFLAHVGEWKGLPQSDLLDLMCGRVGGVGGWLGRNGRLKKAFAEGPAARKVLASDGDPATVFANLRSLGAKLARRSPPTSTCRQSPHRRLRHCRAVGARNAGRTASDHPHRRRAGGTQSASDVDARIAVSPRKGPRSTPDAEFDELLGEARLIYRLRDERGVYSDIWASGLMRRAALAVGRRVSTRGAYRRSSAHVRGHPR